MEPFDDPIKYLGIVR